MSDGGDLEYPNLSGCHVQLTSGSSATSRPPVRLPESVSKTLQEVNDGSRTPYDFSLGKSKSSERVKNSSFLYEIITKHE